MQRVVERDQLLTTCRQLATEYEMLTDIAGVDHFGEDPRYEVVYHLYSLKTHQLLRLKVKVPEDDMIVDSVVSIWKTADWHEREAFDMFGIRFRNHPNLKRILMWEGYPYFPLRKDFPLAGIQTELPDYAENAGKVEKADMLGGPFFGGTGTNSARRREPRQYDTPADQQEHLKK